MNSDEKEFLNSLTDEERAEIDAASEEETTTEEATETTTAKADEAPSEPAGEEKAAKTDETQEENVELAEPVLSPLQARAPENVQELLNAIHAEEDALAQKFDDGDITAREYREAINKLNTQREDVNWSVRKAELSREMQETAMLQSWQRDVEEFMNTTAVHITRSHAAMVAFDDIVKKITSDPANASISNRAQLEKAFKIYSDEMAATFGVQPQAQQQAKSPPPAKPIRNIPPTLARVPAAESENIDGGKFAALDRLAAADPAAYEAAVGKMSEAERAQFESVI